MAIKYVNKELIRMKMMAKGYITWEDIDALPSVEMSSELSVTPAKGKWLYHTIGIRKCSCCGSLWSTDITRNVFCCYCPRCGAKMEGESE